LLRQLPIAVLFFAMSASAYGEQSKFLFRQPDASAAAPISIQVGETAVDIANSTPSGHVLLVNAGLESYGGMLVQRGGSQDLVAGSDGTCRYVSKSQISLRSVWIAVDIETGQYVTGSRMGYIAIVQPLSPTLLSKDASGVMGVTDIEARSLDLYFVRPKQGAWRLRAAQGGPDNAQMFAGKLKLSSVDAQPVVGKDPPPSRLKTADLVILINTGRLETLIAEIGK
jgi:hypothetical protein